MCIPDSSRIFSSDEAASLGKNLSKQTSLARNVHRKHVKQVFSKLLPKLKTRKKETLKEEKIQKL